MILSWKGFWFAGVLVGVVWALIVTSRLRPLVARKPDLADAARRLSLGFGLTFSVPFVVLGVLQIAGGIPNWTYVYSRDSSNPWVVAAWAVVAASYGFILWWIWAGGADSALANFGGVLPEGFREPRRVKLLLSIAVVAFFVGYVAEVLRGGPSIPAA